MDSFCLKQQRIVSFIVLIALGFVSILNGCAHIAHAQAKDDSASQSVLQKHYDDAQKFQASGDLPQAARQYRIFIADALDELAIAYAHIEDYDKAAPLFDEALKLAPNSPALQIEYAQAALTHGELSRARSLSEEVLRSYPENKKACAKAQLILGRVLLKMSKDEEARKHFEAAVALEPNFENGYALGVACLDMEDGKCAAKVFAEMLESFGDSAVIHQEFGRAYSGSDFQQEAIEEYQKAIAKDDRLPGVHYALAAMYLASGEDAKSKEVEVELHKELAVSPNDSLTYAALGHLEFGQQKYADAERDLTHAVTLNPESPDAYLYLGQLYMETNRPSETESALRKSISLTKDVSHDRYQVQKAHYLLGRLLRQSGRVEEAKSEMQIASTLTKQSLGQDRDRLAEYLQDQPTTSGMGGGEKLAQASITPQKSATTSRNAQQIEIFEKQLTPPVADSYNNLGVISAGNQDFGSALNYFERAAEWNPSLEGLDYNWGRAAFSASRFQEAVLPLGRSLHSHPEDTAVRSMLAMSQFMIKDYSSVVKTMKPMEGQADKVPQLDYVYADSLVKTGNVDAGIERLKALAQAHPEIADVHRSLAEALGQRGDKTGAERETKQYETLHAMQNKPN